MDAELTRDRADLPLLGVIKPQDLRPGLPVYGHLTPLVPGAAPCAGPDGRTSRRTGRRCCSGRPRGAPRPRRAVCRDASSASLARQHGGADGSKGDASLSARTPHFEPPHTAAGPDSVSGAPRACDAPAGRPGSAARQDAATLGARSRCTLGSSSGCRGRSGGRERLAGGTADSGTGGRSSASRRSMRTGSTPAKSRTILCIWAVPGTARGVRRRLLPPSKRGRRRIVLSGPTLPPAISMSGGRSWANLATARGLWTSGLPLRA